MLEDLQKLIELQQIDREIHRLNEEVAALPRKVSEIESKLATTKAQLDQAQATIKADEAARRKLESKILDHQQKISKYRDQSLAVKTNDQYKALMHEISFAEQDIRKLEDQMLESMLDVDVNQKAVKAAELELAHGTHARLRSLALSIIEDQAREIGLMQAYRDLWYGGSAMGHMGGMSH